MGGAWISSPRVQLSPTEIRDINARYHDGAAAGYDSKWGIDYGEVGGRQVTAKLAKALGSEPAQYPRALEVGAGTGYFTLNLLRRGVIERATALDISAGMLERLRATADRLGLEVETVHTDAERLPFESETFDLVMGHAVLHHLPHLETAFFEFERVLAPGGTLVFMGEPSLRGHRLAALPKRLGNLAAPAWRRLFEGPAGAGADDDSPPASDAVAERATSSNGCQHASYTSLEFSVDVHVFTPGELRALAEGAGLVDVRVGGEELLASAYGWLLRTLEAGADPQRVPRAWHEFAFRSYLALQWVDGKLLEPRLPADFFYNLLLSARKAG
jgi:SAM-dependent methyltransferase